MRTRPRAAAKKTRTRRSAESRPTRPRQTRPTTAKTKRGAKRPSSAAKKAAPAGQPRRKRSPRGATTKTPRAPARPTARKRASASPVQKKRATARPAARTRTSARPAARTRGSRATAPPPSPATVARIRELEGRVRSLEAELAATRREASALAAQSRPERPDSEPAAPRASAESAASSEGAPDPGASQKLEEEPPYEKYDEEEDFSDSLAGLEQRRRELDRERADRELELGHEPFWMVCPKCGEHLGDHEFDNIKTERCDSCAGLWIDKGEIDLLLLFSEEDRVLAYRARGLLQ